MKKKEKENKIKRSNLKISKNLRYDKKILSIHNQYRAHPPLSFHLPTNHESLIMNSHPVWIFASNYRNTKGGGVCACVRVSIENGRVSRGTIHFERCTQSTRSSHSDTVHARGMIPVENNKDAIPHEGVCAQRRKQVSRSLPAFVIPMTR